MIERDPALIWRPLSEAVTQPHITPTQWIVHTAVDAPGPTNLWGYFENHTALESHTWLTWVKHEQFIGFSRSADANYKANRRPDGTGAISTETEDDGNPVAKPWNAYQLGELVRFGTWLSHTYAIPARLPRTPSEPGMGYHSLFPGVWSNVPGKTCPGSTRIAQFKTVVLPSIVAALQEDDMPTTQEIVDALRPVIAAEVNKIVDERFVAEGTVAQEVRNVKRLCVAAGIATFEGGDPDA